MGKQWGVRTRSSRVGIEITADGVDIDTSGTLIFYDLEGEHRTIKVRKQFFSPHFWLSCERIHSG